MCLNCSLWPVVGLKVSLPLEKECGQLTVHSKMCLSWGRGLIVSAASLKEFDLNQIVESWTIAEMCKQQEHPLSMMTQQFGQIGVAADVG